MSNHLNVPEFSMYTHRVRGCHLGISALVSIYTPQHLALRLSLRLLSPKPRTLEARVVHDAGLPLGLVRGGRRRRFVGDAIYEGGRA